MRVPSKEALVVSASAPKQHFYLQEKESPRGCSKEMAGDTVIEKQSPL